MHVVTLAGIPASDGLFQELAIETQCDEELATLLDYLRTGWPRSRKQAREFVRQYFDQQQLFSMVQGVVLRGDRIFIPRGLRKAMIEKTHEGHLGIAKTKARAREHMWWPGMGKAFEERVMRCDTCAEHHHQQRKEPLRSTPLPDRPWQHVASDLFELKGKHYILIVDYYSRFPEIRRLGQIGARAVIMACKKIFSVHGIPELLVSDNGPQYNNAEFKRFAEEWQFEHATSSPRYPQGNGLAERTVQTVKGLMEKADSSGTDFQLALLAYRTSPHESTGGSPAQLLMGRKTRSRLPASPEMLRPQIIPHHEVEERDKASKQKQARYYNTRNGARPLESLETGDRVLIWDIDSRTWRIPGTLVRRLGERSYLVRLESGRTLRRNRMQIQKRPKERDVIHWSEEDEAVTADDATTAEEQTETEKEQVQTQEADKRVEEQRQEAGTEVRDQGDQRQEQVTTTRYGRVSRRPKWQENYVK